MKKIWLPRLALVLLAPALAAQACAKGDDSVTSVYNNSTLGDQGGTAGSTVQGGASGVGAAGSSQAGGGGKPGAGAGGQSQGGAGTSGAAGASCGQGYELCDGLCTFTSADPKHCGDCSIGCADGVACVAGKCGGSAGQGGSGNAGSGNAGSGQGGEAGSGNAGSGNAGSGAGGSAAGSGQAGSGQAGSGQAGSGQAGQGNAGSGNAGSGGCAPVSCQDRGYTCGATTDGCGQPLDCGGCTGPEICGGTAPHQCGIPCDPLAQNCAPPGACYPQTGGSGCATAGMVADGAGCAFANDCQPGSVCLTLAMKTLCHRICDPKGGSPGCTAPATCGKVNDTYGICVSP
jgi:hypothetical protein